MDSITNAECNVRSGSLWRHSGFVKLWIGQTISELGSRITREGLPLTAVLVLKAQPFQMGVMTAVGAASALLFGLVAGVYVDRMRRRPHHDRRGSGAGGNFGFDSYRRLFPSSGNGAVVHCKH